MKIFDKQTSIAKRLAYAYATAAAIVLSIIVIGLYCIEISEINRYQKAEMKNRIALLEHSVSDMNTPQEWQHLKQTLQKLTPPDSDIYIRISSPEPNFNFEAPFKVDASLINKHSGFSKADINGREFRILSRIIPAQGQRYIYTMRPDLQENAIVVRLTDSIGEAPSALPKEPALKLDLEHLLNALANAQAMLRLQQKETLL